MAVRTPLLSSPQIDAALGARILVKAECLQRTGSFKFRGAYNALAQLAPGKRRAGVVAYSSGNHAQGVAAAAQLLGMPATIVMPADAPAIKIANTRFYGAEIVAYDRYRESREAIAQRIAAERGAEILPPFDDARVIAGQGTIGLEIGEEARRHGWTIDLLIAPCSGGGLVTGCALGLAAVATRRRDLCRRTGAARRHAALARSRQTRRQRSRGALDLRRAAGADAGRDHFRLGAASPRRQHRRQRRRGTPRDGHRVLGLQAGAGARRRGGLGRGARRQGSRLPARRWRSSPRAGMSMPRSSPPRLPRSKRRPYSPAWAGATASLWSACRSDFSAGRRCFSPSARLSRSTRRL